MVEEVQEEKQFFVSWEPDLEADEYIVYRKEVYSGNYEKIIRVGKTNNYKFYDSIPVMNTRDFYLREFLFETLHYKINKIVDASEISHVPWQQVWPRFSPDWYPTQFIFETAIKSISENRVFLVWGDTDRFVNEIPLSHFTIYRNEIEIAILEPYERKYEDTLPDNPLEDKYEISMTSREGFEGDRTEFEFPSNNLSDVFNTDSVGTLEARLANNGEWLICLKNRKPVGKQQFMLLEVFPTLFQLNDYGYAPRNDQRAFYKQYDLSEYQRMLSPLYTPGVRDLMSDLDLVLPRCYGIPLSPSNKISGTFMWDDLDSVVSDNFGKYWDPRFTTSPPGPALFKTFFFSWYDIPSTARNPIDFLNGAADGVPRDKFEVAVQFSKTGYEPNPKYLPSLPVVSVYESEQSWVIEFPSGSVYRAERIRDAENNVAIFGNFETWTGSSEDEDWVEGHEAAFYLPPEMLEYFIEEDVPKIRMEFQFKGFNLTFFATVTRVRSEPDWLFIVHDKKEVFFVREDSSTGYLLVNYYAARTGKAINFEIRGNNDVYLEWTPIVHPWFQYYAVRFGQGLKTAPILALTTYSNLLHHDAYKDHFGYYWYEVLAVFSPTVSIPIASSQFMFRGD